MLATTLSKIIESAATVNNSRIVVGELPQGTIGETVRAQVDKVRNSIGSAFIVLVWVEGEGKVSLLVALTSDLVKKGMKAGEVVKAIATIVDGSGGGRPDIAQAGGKDASKLPEALAAAIEMSKAMLSK